MIQLTIIGVYLLLLLVVGVCSHRVSLGTSKDYLLASHSIGPVLLLLSLFGTTMTAFALVGSTGESFKQGVGVYGLMASSSGIVHSLCFFLVGVKLWSLGRRYGFLTQIQFFRERLESDRFGLLLFPVLVGLLVPYLLIGVMASGSVINGVTRGTLPDLWSDYGGGVPPWLGSLVICLVVLAYVFFGGMRGTAWANAFQTCVFMIMGIVTFLVIAWRLGGHDSLLANLRAVTQAVPPEKLARTHMPQAEFLSYMLIPLSVAMFPHLFQHWLTARHAKTFKLTVVAHPLMIMALWVPCVMIGVWGTTKAAGLAPTTNPNMVLAILVDQLAGPTLGGLLTAGILAAIMSSLDSQFLCLGTMFTNDIVFRYAGANRFNDRQKVLLARGFIVAIVALTYAISLLGRREVFTLAIWSFSGFSSLFPLVFAALYWRRLTAAGAYAGLIAAMVSWLILFWQSGWASNTGYTIGNMMPVVVMTACSTVAMILVTLVTSPPSEATVAKFFPKAELR